MCARDCNRSILSARRSALLEASVMSNYFHNGDVASADQSRRFASSCPAGVAVAEVLGVDWTPHVSETVREGDVGECYAVVEELEGEGGALVDVQATCAVVLAFLS